MKMSDGGIALLDMLVFGPPAILLLIFAFACAVEGWRRWSENRRIRKHFEY